MFGTENKAIQCDLTASIRGSEVTQILGNTKDNKLTRNISGDSTANSIRVFESVNCSDPSFAQDNEQVGEAEQGQNEQTVSNNGGGGSESGKDEQQRPNGGATDGNKASLPGDREVCLYFELIISFIKASLFLIPEQYREDMFH